MVIVRKIKQWRTNLYCANNEGAVHLQQDFNQYNSTSNVRCIFRAVMTFHQYLKNDNLYSSAIFLSRVEVINFPSVTVKLRRHAYSKYFLLISYIIHLELAEICHRLNILHLGKINLFRINQ